MDSIANQTSGIAIETNVPVPYAAKIGRPKIPMLDLNVGNSFVLQGRKLDSVRALISTVHLITDQRLIARPVDGGIRVWRVA